MADVQSDGEVDVNCFEENENEYCDQEYHDDLDDRSASADRTAKGSASKRGKRDGSDPERPTPVKKKLKGTWGAPKYSKHNNRQCRGCKKWFGADGMSAGKCWCHRDNRAMDNIRYAAVKQGRLDWYTRMKNDDTKLTLTLSEYHRRCPDTMDDAGQRRKKTPTNVTFQMLESVIVSTKVIRETEGEMMWEKEFVEFAQTKSGGGMSDDGARARWQKWVEEIASDKMDEGLHDQGGPEWSPLRFWVKTRDKIVYQDVVERQKKLQVAEKEPQRWVIGWRNV